MLERQFRKLIGCEQKPFIRPSRSLLNVEAYRMIIRPEKWNPEVIPYMKLTEEDVRSMAEELANFHKQFHSCFGRLEHQRLGLAYISGLLSNSPAKSVEPIALELLDARAVRSLQKFMKNYLWDHEAMEAAHQKLLAEEIASPEGLFYFAAIRSNTHVFLKKPKVGLSAYQGRGRHPQAPQVLKGRSFTVAEVARSKKHSWSRVILAEGAKADSGGCRLHQGLSVPKRSALCPALAVYKTHGRRGNQVCLFQCPVRYTL